MGVVSFFNTFSSNRKTDPSFTTRLMDANQTLDQVFRTIALEKNQMLYPVSTNAISHKEHQSAVVIATKKLVTNLQHIDNQGIESTDFLDFINTIHTLETAIATYQTDEQSLPQLLLACSSIKLALEKMHNAY